MSNSTKIFVVYHKPSPVFESDIFVPIQVGAQGSAWNSGFVRDDSGDNISSKNPFYCELTGLYWAWKNYLPAHPEVDCIGLCHYRRFLNPFQRGKDGFPFRPESFSRFAKTFARWDSHEMDRLYHQTDVVLPAKINLRKSWLYDRKGESVYSQLAKRKLSGAIGAMIAELIRRHPDHSDDFRRFFLGPEFHCCLTFVMKRNAFLPFAEWLFAFLGDLATIPDERIRANVLSSRVPGYLAERLVDVWLILHPELTVAECDSIGLCEKKPSFLSDVRLRLRRFRHPPAKADRFPVPPVLVQ